MLTRAACDEAMQLSAAGQDGCAAAAWPWQKCTTEGWKVPHAINSYTPSRFSEATTTSAHLHCSSTGGVYTRTLLTATLDVAAVTAHHVEFDPSVLHAPQRHIGSNRHFISLKGS